MYSHKARRKEELHFKVSVLSTEAFFSQHFKVLLDWFVVI